MKNPDLKKIQEELRKLDLFAILSHQALEPDRCIYCHTYLHRGNRTRDHLIPRQWIRRSRLCKELRSQLGRFNVVPCCRRCNQLKTNHTLSQFYQEVKARPMDRRVLILLNLRKLSKVVS